MTDNDNHFLPENLDFEFQKDSLRVHFEGFITDKVTTTQWGRTIVITNILKIQ